MDFFLPRRHHSAFVCVFCISVVYFYHGGTEGTKIHGGIKQSSVFLHVLCVSVVTLFSTKENTNNQNRTTL